MKNRILQLLCIAVILLAAASIKLAAAETTGKCGDNLTWVLDDHGLLTISGTGKMTSHGWARTVKHVVIEDGATNIVSNAFCYCYDLQTVEMPDSVTMIDSYAFSDCSALESVRFSANLKIINENAFSGCRALKSISLPEHVTINGYSTFYQYDGTVFYQQPYTFTAHQLCNKGLSFRIPGTSYDIRHYIHAEPDRLALASVDTDVTDLVIPDIVDRIESSACEGRTRLMSVQIPATVTEIGSCAFSGCTGLTEIYLPDSAVSIDPFTFRGCTALNSVRLPEGITQITGGMFENCTSLETITIPDSVTAILGSAFTGCTSLSHVQLPAELESIDMHAFAGCTSLKGISLPSTLTRMQGEAFRWCSNLYSITVYSDADLIGTEILIVGPNTTIFSHENAAIRNSAEEYGIAWAPIPVRVLNIPDNVQTIEAEAFAGLKQTDAIRIPSSVMNIDNSAFSDSDIILKLPENSTWFSWAVENGYKVMVE